MQVFAYDTFNFVFLIFPSEVLCALGGKKSKTNQSAKSCKLPLKTPYAKS